MEERRLSCSRVSFGGAVSGVCGGVEVKSLLALTGSFNCVSPLSPDCADTCTLPDIIIALTPIISAN